MPESTISAGKLQTVAMGTKEVTEVGLFSFFAKMKTFAWFGSHVLRFIFFPLIGLVFLTNAIIESYKLYKAKNQNAESVASMITAYAVAGLAITSITGTLLASVGVIAAEFVLGPFLFVGALATAFLHQLGMGIINTIRFFMAPQGSEERQGFKQAIFNNGYNMLLLAAVTSMITVLMISPAGPAVLAGLAGTAIALTAINFIWKVMPSTLKNGIKDFFGFAKPTIEVTPNTKAENSPAVLPTHDITSGTKDPSFTSSKGLFTASFRKHKVIQIINNNGLQTAKAYLLNEIRVKREKLEGIEARGTKTQSKLNVLQHLSDAVEKGSELEGIEKLAGQHHKAFQSFFAGVSDTEDLYKAVKTYKDTLTLHPEAAANMNAKT